MRRPVVLRGRRDRPDVVSPPTSPSGSVPTTGCHAPAVQLFLQPDGSVRPCCRHLLTLGNIADRRLTEIWEGERRRELVERLARFDYSAGCENCEREIAVEGEQGSYARFFDIRATHLDDGPDADRWPRWIDFNLSNTCNLQCVQCSGDLSSSIRLHREKRPPLRSPYGDAFYEDLRLFIPHLDGALFAGGEPFLANENYRVWSIIEELNPDLLCIVTTNATQWNARVRAALERLRFSFVISLDGITKETFESIRIGADFDEVLENVDHYLSYAARVGTEVTINHCLMPQNVGEFGDLLLWAEGKGLKVNVSVVREPAWTSISRLAAVDLRSVHDQLLGRQDDVLGRLRLNDDTWRSEVARIGAWADLAEAGRSGESGLDRTVMFFRQAGSGPSDDLDAADLLRRASVDGVVHVIDVGADDLISSVTDSVRSLLGEDAERLIGRHYGNVEEFAQRLYGSRTRYEVLEQGEDRLDARAVYGGTEMRIAMVPLRGPDGIARSGRVLMTVTAEPS